MEIDYNFPGPIRIDLDAGDVASIRKLGYCMDRDGFLSIESKTWVRLDSQSRDARAEIDGDGDLNVYLPDDAFPPVVIDRERVQPGNNVRGDGIVEHFLADGSIEIIWPRI